MSESQPLCISWKSALLSPTCPDKVSVLSSCQSSLPRPPPLQNGAPLDRLAPDGSSIPPGPRKPSPALAHPLWGGTRFWGLTRCTEAGCVPHTCNPDLERNDSLLYIVRSDLTKRVSNPCPIVKENLSQGASCFRPCKVTRTLSPFPGTLSLVVLPSPLAQLQAPPILLTGLCMCCSLRRVLSGRSPWLAQL